MLKLETTGLMSTEDFYKELFREVGLEYSPNISLNNVLCLAILKELRDIKKVMRSMYMGINETFYQKGTHTE